MTQITLASIKSDLKVDSNGIGYCSIRGAAKLAGVVHSTLIEAFSSGRKTESKLSQKLIEHGFDGGRFSEVGIPDTALAIILEYYAFDAGARVTEEAKRMYKALANVGLRVMIQNVCGWSPIAKESDEMLMARALQASARLLEAAQLEVQQLKPKAILADDFIERDGLTLIGDFAKDLGCIGRNDLFQLLRDKKVIYRLKDKSHQPYQRYVDSGFFVLKPAGVSIGGKERFTCCLTPAGVQWLNEQLKIWQAK